jgi:hypothetical protein
LIAHPLPVRQHFPFIGDYDLRGRPFVGDDLEYVCTWARVVQCVA